MKTFNLGKVSYTGVGETRFHILRFNNDEEANKYKQTKPKGVRIEDLRAFRDTPPDGFIEAFKSLEVDEDFEIQFHEMWHSMPRYYIERWLKRILKVNGRLAFKVKERKLKSIVITKKLIGELL